MITRSPSYKKYWRINIKMTLKMYLHTSQHCWMENGVETWVVSREGE